VTDQGQYTLTESKSPPGFGRGFFIHAGTLLGCDRFDLFLFLEPTHVQVAAKAFLRGKFIVSARFDD
jgi:hypothetical protein